MPDYGTWTTKAGVQHVEPPAKQLAGMVTLRLHLDPVGADNAPLLVASDSYGLGRIAEEQIATVVERGDLWV